MFDKVKIEDLLVYTMISDLAAHTCTENANVHAEKS